MIIKEIKIDVFGGIENKIIKFNRGLNLIYGENERGKSSIEAFIKSMLYGFPQKRGKGDGDRKKYLPFKGGTIKGSLILEHENHEYIIQRTFGSTKKEDISKIFDGVTGEEINNMNLEEPGKSFLGINRSTFEKTLFVNQLGVAFTKDKEEEIMEKITALFGCSEDEVPATKALEKLEGIKKGFTTTRGVGTLDLLKKKQSVLIEERYEGYKIAEQNLEWENRLLEAKELRKKLREEINKLEVYKKYIKKINLQNEYKDITTYLKKSEELKREEKEIQHDLGGDLIDESFIEALKEENIIYLNLIDRREELKDEITNLERIFDNKHAEMQEYKFLELFGDDIKEKLISLKYEQQTLSEKIEYMNKINNSIKSEEDELNIKRNSLGQVSLVKDLKEDIERDFKLYEDSLRELKIIVEENKIDSRLENKLKKEKINIVAGILSLIIGVVLSIFGLPILIIGILGVILGLLLIFMSSTELRKLSDQKIANEKIETLNKEVSIIEEGLNGYLERLKLKDYSELITTIRKYSSFKEYEERILFRIEEKKKIINEENYSEIREIFKKNLDMINSLRNLSGCSNIDQVIDMINIYEKLRREIEGVEAELSNCKKSLIELESDISIKEEKLKDKLQFMDLDLGNLLDIEIYIKEYKEKLKKRSEIHANLSSMEETYNALLKDRDINVIKEELKDIINENNEFSYQSEDEIEAEEKKKSNELLECEKKIKDFENSIATRMIGKRSIVEIEEEIQVVEGKVAKGEDNVRALDLAIETLKDSFTEIRRDIGPAINKKVSDNFKVLTGGKYDEVKLGDNYEMMVKDNKDIFKGSYLSNGAWDQLYLSLRIAFIDLLFHNEECPIILDDAFVQYDDNRRERALLFINDKLKGQGIIFTCQKNEEYILRKNDIEINKIII